jgi:3-methylcrotonyl-CoA carboxylase alpha subunit
MKMEYTIKAPATGKVESFFFGVGDQVPEGTQLLRFEHDSE